MQQTAWNDGAAYERYVGQWSRIIAPRFIAWLAAAQRLTWLDVACGTGALTEAILFGAQPSAVDAIDRSPAYLEYARGHISDQRVRFEEGSAESLPYPDSSFDIAISGLVLNFIDARRAVAEQRRVTKPGGTIAAYIWDYADGYEYARLFWDAAIAVDSAAAAYDPRVLFSLCQGAGLGGLFRENGLTEVETTHLDATASLPHFDAYWQALDARQGSTAEYLSRIGDATREKIQRELSSRVRRDQGGAVHLNLRAIAVKGRLC
ncbi:MAG TPA: class I SAM-dependent methyltransferase [Bryobacteraceae bacterium]|nr:class I SAM-dependent methyltransferase [Bryobacteraceae bacterium]